MMRKKIVSLCMALVLCLALLPATALAADGYTVYVGGVALTGSTGSPAYATTDKDTGVVTHITSTDGEPVNWNIKWDGSTLTLRNATIKKELYDSNLPPSYIAGAAIGVLNQSGDAELTITLEGTNTIEDVSAAIHVFALSGSASLTITGDGILSASSGFNPGIKVQSNTGNGTLAITGAKVTASSSSSGNGVQIRCGDSSNASLTVDGGNLTATATGSNSGIYFQFGSGDSGSGAPSLTVSGNAIVRANGSAGGITSNSSTEVCTAAGTGESGGIVWNGKNGTVYGDVTLQEDLTIGEDESLTIPDGASLTIGNDATLTNEGTVTTTGNGTLTNNGKIENSGTLPDNIQGTAPPSITTTSLDGGAVGTAYNATLGASGENITWTWAAVTGSSLPPGLELSTSGVISGTPTAQGTSNFTVTASNNGGSDSKEFTLTIDQQGTIHVTSVSLDKANLELTEGETAQLTATVLPDNATNKKVTWSSNAPGVATVDSSGKVTAVAPGTATITAAAADGSGASASCTVTVSSYLPPANPNYRITVEATQGGTVTADPTAAKAGTTVTLTPVPDRGYQVGSVAVTDRFGDAVAVTEQADGTYTFTMPNGQVTVTVTFAEAPLPFPDVTEGDWFYDAVRYAYENGLMDGVGDNLFAPNSETTRAQLVTILYRLAGQPAVSGDLPFPDVESGTWYTDAVAWAAQNGIVNGVSDTQFAPGDDITREQLAAILYRYAACQGYDVSQRADLSGFGDASSISGYAQEALSWAHAQGLVLGFEDGSLRPQGTASRAQIAAVLMRFLAAAPTA